MQGAIIGSIDRAEDGLYHHLRPTSHMSPPPVHYPVETGGISTRFPKGLQGRNKCQSGLSRY